MKLEGINFEAMSDLELWQIADEMMDHLMVGSTAIDHAMHTRDFTPRLLAIVTPEYLTKVCHTYQHEKGYFAQRKRVALFRRPNSVAFIWTQYFTQQVGEFVAEMVLVNQNDSCLVDHVMVF
ncbi:MAG: hypothetical protein WA154_00300 [Moraxellaceae bacterium]